MPPTVPGPSRTKSLLTNRKLLDAFKGLKPNKIKIDDVSSLGDKYMQKATSIRFGYFLNWNDFSLFVKGGFHLALPIFAWNKGNSNAQETQRHSKFLNRNCFLGLLKRSSTNKSPVFLLVRMLLRMIRLALVKLGMLLTGMLLVTVRMGRRDCQDMVLLHVEDALVG